MIQYTNLLSLSVWRVKWYTLHMLQLSVMIWKPRYHGKCRSSLSAQTVLQAAVNSTDGGLIFIYDNQIVQINTPFSHLNQIYSFKRDWYSTLFIFGQKNYCDHSWDFFLRNCISVPVSSCYEKHASHKLLFYNKMQSDSWITIWYTRTRSCFYPRLVVMVSLSLLLWHRFHGT